MESENNEEIQDYDSYLSRMKKSIDDKIFFTSYLGLIDSFVDFGCADGELLKRVHELCPQLQLFGIDNSSSMISMSEPNSSVYQSILSDLPIVPTGTEGLSALNLSSVLHEVYNYGDYEYIKSFMQALKDSEYEYIFIRDMYYKNFTRRQCLVDVDYLSQAIYAYGDTNQIIDFEKIYGRICQDKQRAIHFLLKYTYKENWRREVEENYFSVDFDNFLYQLENKYKCIHYEYYVNQFIARRIRRDFHIDFYQPTHIKVVLKKSRMKI